MKSLAEIWAGVQANLTVGAVTALVAVAIFAGGYIKGAAGVRTECEAEKAKRTARAAEVKADQAEAVTKEVIKYVDRVRIVRQKGDTIVKEVPVYVPSDACPLPGGFRLLHDAAARGEPADPAGIPDAAPVEAQTLAATVAENYEACRLNAEQLTTLQALLRKLKAAADAGHGFEYSRLDVTPLVSGNDDLAIHK